MPDSKLLGIVFGLLFLAAAGWMVQTRAPQWDQASAEQMAHYNLNGMREEVAKAIKEGRPLDILAEPPALWVTLFATGLPHASGATMSLRHDREPQDTGYWAYDRKYERLYIDCTHTDSKGTVWTAY